MDSFAFAVLSFIGTSFSAFALGFVLGRVTERKRT